MTHLKLLFFLIILLTNITFAKFEFGWQLFDTDSQQKIRFSPLAMMLNYNFTENNDSTIQYLLSSYFAPASLIDNLFSDLFNLLNSGKNYLPYYYLGGGIRYRHQLSNAWFLDSEIIGSFLEVTKIDSDDDSTGFFTPIYGFGFFNKYSNMSYKVHIIPYHKKFGPVQHPFYFMTLTFHL